MRRFFFAAVIAALCLALWPSPSRAQSAPIPSQAFGFSMSPATIGDLTRYPSVPFGSMRVSGSGVDWPSIEPSNGTFNFTSLDQWLSLVQSHSENAMLTLGRTPSWAGATVTSPPTDVNSGDNFWKAYVTATVNHINASATGKIHYYEIWNEADSNWTGTFAQMVTMATDAYSIIHALDPTAKVLTPSISSCCGSGNGYTWMSGYLAAGGAATTAQDIVAIHAYPAGTEPLEPTGLPAEIDTIRALMTTNGIGSEPIWFTEGAWNGSNPTSKTDAQQIAWMAQQYLYMIEKGVARYMWFQWDNVTGCGGSGCGTMYIPSTATVKPVGTAYGILYGWLVGSTITTPCSASGTVWTCGIKTASGSQELIVWDTSGSSTYTPTNNYTHALDLTGGTTAISGGGSLTIGNAPLLLSNDVFISQSGAGTQDALTCPTAKPASYFNTAGNWSATPTGVQIGPGITVHLCPGTFTFGSRATGLTFQGSGTSGNPIHLLFDTGAILQSPDFYTGIEAGGRHDITIDGGTNGIIQNTAKGYSLTYNTDTPTRGIGASGCTPNCRITNLTIQNLFVRHSTDPLNSVTQQSMNAVDTNANGGGSGTKANGLRVDHNTIHDCGWCLNVRGDNLEVDHSEVYNMDHGIAVGTAPGETLTSMRFHDNHFHDMAAWDNGGHHDFIHVFSDNSGPITDTRYYDNLMDGNWGTTVTAGIYDESNNGNPIVNSKVFNNVFILSSAVAFGAITLQGGNNVSSGALVAYNYVAGQSGGSVGSALFVRGYQTVTVYGNVLGGLVSDIVFSTFGGGAAPPTAIDYNLYQDLFTDYGSFNTFSFYATADSRYSVWLSQCQAVISTCDTHSFFRTFAAMDFDATGHPLAGSPAIRAGINLTSLGITALNADKNGVARPATGNWTIGAFNAPGSTPAISISPSPVNFPGQTQFTTSSPIAITVKNVGAGTLILNNPPTSMSGTNPTDFSDTGTGTCGAGASIPPGSTCIVNATFTPKTTGAETATLGINGNAPGSVILNGAGVAPVAPAVTITPASPINFGSINQGASSGAFVVTVQNSGTAPLHFLTPGLTITGDFSISSTTCSGATVAVNGTCTASLIFSPTAAGTRTGTLTVQADAPGSASLTGTGIAIAPVIIVTPRPVSFPGVFVGSTGNLVATVTNNGTATETFASSLTTVTGSEFSVVAGGTCSGGGTLGAGLSCTINLSFTPSGTGLRTGTLTVNGAGAGQSSNTVALNGTGVAVSPPAAPIPFMLL
jgi:putative glycosyl hydrolase/HYDIN/CFA65/VesB family protein